MTLVGKIQTIGILVLFFFWFFQHAYMGFDAIATASGFWISTAFYVWVNHTIKHGFKP